MTSGTTVPRTPKPAPSPRQEISGSSAGASSSGTKPAPGKASPAAPAPRGRASAGMRPHEGQLSGYLLARAAMRRKIDDAVEINKQANGRPLKSENVLKDLRAANDTVEETRMLLPNGRGNVKGDILATDGEASRRFAAGAAMTKSYLGKMGINPASHHHFAMQAETAVSLFTGQATCGGSALVAVHVHAPKLQQGQYAVPVANVKVDHMWTESRRTGWDRNNDQMIDRWTSGPAVLREDSSYGLEPKVHEDYPLYRSNRKNAINQVNRIREDINKDHALKAEFEANLADLKKSDYRFRGKVWDEESVMGEGFRRNAGMLLHPDYIQVPNSDKVLGTDKPMPVRPYSLEILAVGVARSLGEEVPGALEKAPHIVDMAKRMFPKPSGSDAGPSNS